MNLLTPCEPRRVDAGAALRPAALEIEHGTLNGTGARLEVAAASARSLRHDINEDAHSALRDASAPLYVVADGVGGGAMAWRASRELVALTHAALTAAPIDGARMCDALTRADLDIARSIAAHTDQLGAATAVVCAAVDGAFAHWLIAWVGDCRAYRVPVRADEGAQLLTRDDTYGNRGEMPPPGGSPDDPARMIGNGAVGIPSLARACLQADEMLVLCTDGVHKHVEARDMTWLLRRSGVPLPRRCARIIALARARGSRDDATVLVVQRTTAVRDHTRLA